jgi:RNA polymerase-binding transcription factor DksA
MAAKPKKKPTKTAGNKATAKTKAAPKASKPKKKPAAKAKSKAAPKAKAKTPAVKKSAPAKATAAKAKPAEKGKVAATAGNGRGAKPPVKAVKILPPVIPPPKPIRGISLDEMPPLPPMKRPPLPAAFLKRQRQRLVELQTHLLDSMEGVAKDSLRTRPEGSEASVGGMHMGDAGSDAYDRDFALSLLSKEQDALNEILEAIKRIDGRTYGYCEMTGKKISDERLEALPFTRFTREAQEQLERDQFGGRVRRIPQRSVFSLDEDAEGEEEEGEEEESPAPAKESSLDFMKE